MSTDPFDTLGVPARFSLDLRDAESKHRALSSLHHPDRHVQAPAAERRHTLDRAIAVNEAWRLLRDPVLRAEALLRRHGVPVGELAEPKAAPALLMEMMEVREELAAAKASGDLSAVSALGDRMRAREADVLSALEGGFDQAGGDVERLRALLPTLGTLRYLRRFFEELDAIEDLLVA